jgi:phosphatidylserine/phosphatidylglycerophosphate/cardiolipin synthase-like enzyme
VLGLLNKDGVVQPSLHKAANTKLAAATALETSELEQQQLQWHEESMYHSGVFIHTKIILLDPLSDSPVVITGSANFSNNSSVNNDENQLFIVGEKAVADIYLGEFLRMFDHYYFRSHKKKITASSSAAGERKKAFLCPDDDWTGEYFSGGPKQASREAFF